MNYKNSLLQVLLTCLLVSSGIFVIEAQAQASEDKPDFGTYYYQRKTLFEQLPNAEDEIILLGDSITDGNEWSELFGNNRLKNRGISGDVTEGVLYRLDEVTESDPAKVFIMIGVNDLARDRSSEQVLANYEKIVERIQQDSPETEIYIQSILPVNDSYSQFTSHYDKTPEIREVNEGLKSMADDKGARYINLFDDMSNGEGKLNPEYTEDGLHLNGSGYVVWKSVVEKYMD